MSRFFHRRSEQLRIEFSGLATSAFNARNISMLQAFIDDSRKDVGRKILVLAGLINTGDAWLDFSDRWQSILDQSPSIEYFKSVEAFHMRRQFRQWGRSDRDLKIAALASLIDRSEPLSLHVSLDLNDFKAAFSGRTVPYGFQTPYWIAFEAFIIKIGQLLNAKNETGPLNLIFDNQSQILRSARTLFDVIVASQPDDVRPLLAGTPQFMNDKEIVALQAADMLAWHVQREMKDGVLGEKLSTSSQIFGEDRHYYVHLAGDVLDEIAESMSKVSGVSSIRTKREYYKTLDKIDAIVASYSPNG